MTQSQKELASSNDKIKNLEEKITSLNQELSLYKDKCNRLETENQGVNDEIKEKHEEILWLKNQMEKEISNHKQKCSELTSKTDEIIKTNEELLRSKNEMKEEISNYKQKCSELTSNNRGTETKIQDLELEIKSLKNEISDKDEEIKMYKFNEELNQTEIKTLEIQVKEEKYNNKQLTTNINTLKESITEKESLLTSSNNNLASSKNEIHNLNTLIVQMKFQISDRDEKINDLTSEISDKNYEISKLTKNIDSLENQVLELKDRCSELESKKKESENKLQQSTLEFKQKNNDSENKINQLNVTICKLKVEHEENIKQTIKSIEQEQKRKKEENIRNYKEIQTNNYEHIQYFRPKEYYTKSSFKNYIESSIEIPSTTKLLTEGWKLVNNFTQGNYVSISFLGDCSTGKTHLMNQLFGTNVPEIPTNDVKFIHPKEMNNVLLIDNPGLRRPYKSLKLKYSEYDECKKRDFIIKAISIYLSTISFYVVNEFTSDVQKELNSLKSMFVDSPNIEQRTLFIVINKPFITTKEEYEHFMDSYITTHENEDLIKKLPILTKEYIHREAADVDSFFSEDKANRNIIYLLYCPYLLQKYSDSNEYPHKKIKSFIITATQKIIKSLTTELQTIFSKIGESIFNLQNKAADVTSNLIKLNASLKKTDEEKFPKIASTKEAAKEQVDMDSKPITHEELYYWKYFQIIKPQFSYYITEQSKLVIDIECPGITKINMKRTGPTNNYYVFNFGGKKVVNFLDIDYSQEHWTNRLQEDVQLIIKVPSNIGKIKKTAQEKPTYQQGILTFKYDVEPEEDLSD